MTLVGLLSYNQISSNYGVSGPDDRDLCDIGRVDGSSTII
jgi:hypothetical protein